MLRPRSLLGVVGLLVLGACDPGTSWSLPPLADAGPPADGAPYCLQTTSCNMNAQTGCGADERCAWLGNPPTDGLIACVPDGDRAIGEACTWALTFDAMSVDDCMAGGYCQPSDDLAARGGTCVDTCSRDGSGDDCSAGQTCVQAPAGVFASCGSYPSTGLCVEACDPLTQRRASDDREAPCGAPLDDAEQPQAMCALATAVDFACTTIDHPDRGHGTFVPDGEPPAIDSCGPGTVLTYFYIGANLAPPRCVQLCAAGDSSAEDTTNLHGLAGSPYALPALGITSPTEECRYFGWTWNAPATRTASGYDLGFAYDVALYTLGDGTPTPSCADLANADTDGDDINDAEYYGCRRPHWAD